MMCEIHTQSHTAPALAAQHSRRRKQFAKVNILNTNTVQSRPTQGMARGASCNPHMPAQTLRFANWLDQYKR